MSLVWINGQLVDKADAKVGLFDHGFLYGDGVWEPLRVFGGTPFRAAEHARTLFAAAAALRIDIPMSPAELLAAVGATVRANDRREGYVRVIVTRGPGTVGPDPRKLDPQILVTAEEYYPFPLELSGHGLHAATAAIRLDPQCVWVRHRTLGQPYLPLVKRQALDAGCLEAVILDTDGFLTGCTEGQLFLVAGGAVRPVTGFPPDATADAVATVAAEVVPVVTPAPARRDDLLAADEAFLAGTSCGVMAVVRLDGADIGAGREGPVTRAVRERYRLLTRGASPPAAPGPDTIPAEGGAP